MVLEYLSHELKPVKDSGRTLSVLLANKRGQIIEQSFRVPADYSNGSEIRDICDFVKAESTPCFEIDRFKNGFKPWEPYASDFNEGIAFESMHFQRFRALDSAGKLRKRPEGKNQMVQMLTAYTSAKAIGAAIAEKNTGLVQAMTKRIFGSGHMEKIEGGFYALFRAMNNFDYRKGYHFSTYACTAIYRALVRPQIRKTKNKRTKQEVGWEDFDGLPINEDELRKEEFSLQAEFVADALERRAADLTDAEVDVLRRRFNFGEHEHAGSTLDALGKAAGVSKERIRQIQNKALRKLRRYMEKEYFKNPDYQAD